jgi:hypothetical protein
LAPSASCDPSLPKTPDNKAHLAVSHPRVQVIQAGRSCSIWQLVGFTKLAPTRTCGGTARDRMNQEILAGTRNAANNPPTPRFLGFGKWHSHLGLTKERGEPECYSASARSGRPPDKARQMTLVGWNNWQHWRPAKLSVRVGSCWCLVGV